MKKICFATGTRAEYGLLKPLMERVVKEPEMQLQILVTAAHLSPEFGLTYQQIEEDGFKIDRKVEMLLSSDTPQAIVKSMGLGLIGFADAFDELKPDLAIVLGDRYEMLSVCTSALIYKIPVAHIHGGELTEGAYDDAIRHSITKMSHLHFASTEDYRQRIIQLGEDPANVFNVGAIGLDNIRELRLLSREELEKELGIKFKSHNYQVTFHPATLDLESAEAQFAELLSAIDSFEDDSFFIFSKANADTEGRIINQMIDTYVAGHPTTAVTFTSLGSLRFLSLLKICDGIIGNSSSGIIEAPSLGTPTLNIGNRQKGRTAARSVIHCDVKAAEIQLGIKQLRYLNNNPKNFENPYGNGNAGNKILAGIKERLPGIQIQKQFFDKK